MGYNFVGRAIRHSERMKNDEEYRKKKMRNSLNWYYKNRKKCLKRSNKRNKELNIFANNRCKICNKLLSHKTKSGFCFKHTWQKKK